MTPPIKLKPTSNRHSSDPFSRFPFVAADILSSSVKLADAFITEVTKPVVIEEEKDASTPSVVKVTPGIISEDTPGNEENKAIEDALKTSQTVGGEKETLVDDLNAEINGEEEEDDEGNFEHLKEGNEGSGNLPQRSRNAGATALKSEEEKEDEVMTEDIENP